MISDFKIGKLRDYPRPQVRGLFDPFNLQFFNLKSKIGRVNGYPKASVGEPRLALQKRGARQRVGSRVMRRLFEKLARPLETLQTLGAFLNGLRWMAIDGN